MTPQKRTLLSPAPWLCFGNTLLERSPFFYAWLRQKNEEEPEDSNGVVPMLDLVQAAQHGQQMPQPVQNNAAAQEVCSGKAMGEVKGTTVNIAWFPKGHGSNTRALIGTTI